MIKTAVLREMIFTNNKALPTKAQLDYIKDMVAVLGIKPPNIKTRKGASRFITMNQVAYRDVQTEIWAEMNDHWWREEH